MLAAIYTNNPPFVPFGAYTVGFSPAAPAALRTSLAKVKWKKYANRGLWGCFSCLINLDFGHFQKKPKVETEHTESILSF